MYTFSTIIQMLFTTIMLSFIIYALLSMVKIPTTKVMLFGIVLIVFSNSVLKGMIRYGIDDVISVIGLSFCLAGFIKVDRKE